MTGIELSPDDTPSGEVADCLQTASNLITLNFDYGSATQNNGNLVGQTIGASATGIWQQYYTYDGTNRLAMASENAAITGSTCPAGATWCQKYGYDHFGNRWISASLDTLHMATPTAQSAVSLATNRLTSGTYDAAGNLTAQTHITTGGGSMAYDANNKMKSFTATGVAVATYYDTAGRRVRKIYNGQTTIWVYDAFGNLAAEYTTETQTTPVGTYYRTTDHLGSTRLVTDDLGRVRQRHDFFPFGEQIPASASFGNRQDVSDGGLATYNASLSIRQQFTGQQRDEETGLDYFWARNMAAPLGRFLSMDPNGAGASPTLPGTWNAFRYVDNNPLRLIDPDGRADCDPANPYAGGYCEESVSSEYYFVRDENGNPVNTGSGLATAGTGEIGAAEASYAESFVMGFAGRVVLPGSTASSQKDDGLTASGYSQLRDDQCAAAQTVLEREVTYGTFATAMISGNTWGDHTMEPFNSQFNANIQTPIGELDVDWFTDLSSFGSPGLAIYPLGKGLWTAIRLFEEAPITNALPGQDSGEVTAYMYSNAHPFGLGGGGYAGIFTPEYMAEACPQY